jgi:hypothetical protein
MQRWVIELLDLQPDVRPGVNVDEAAQGVGEGWINGRFE